jgi:TPR repeat protein
LYRALILARAGRVSGAMGERAVACIDVDSLAQYERDAREGRADALYNLGLAYSTGQGVTTDMVAAHKWFNLAAVRGVEAAKAWRNQLAAEMSSGQIAEAQRMAREWLRLFK